MTPAGFMLIGGAIGLILGLCLFALAAMERTTRVEKLRPWRICWRCGAQVGENGNFEQEIRVVCDTCIAAAMKRVA